jgi:hypothetical protein
LKRTPAGGTLACSKRLFGDKGADIFCFFRAACLLGIFGRGSSRKEASLSASHLGQELVTRSRLTLARSINRKLQALNSIGRMSWLQVLYQLSLRAEEFSFSRFLRFGHFGLWSGCEERVRHTCDHARHTKPRPAMHSLRFSNEVGGD